MLFAGWGRGCCQQWGDSYQVNTWQHKHCSGFLDTNSLDVWYIPPVLGRGVPAGGEGQVSGPGPGSHQWAYLCQDCVKKAWGGIQFFSDFHLTLIENSIGVSCPGYWLHPHCSSKIQETWPRNWLMMFHESWETFLNAVNIFHMFCVYQLINTWKSK